MRRLALVLVAAIVLARFVGSVAQGSAPVGEAATAIDAGKLPAGFRDWRLITVAHEEGDLHSFAAVLGNDVAIKACRDGTLPFPDGTIIAALHYRHVSSEENDKVFGRAQSFVPGPPTNVQFMVKDSAKYASTGGWLFAHFVESKPVTDPAMIQGCYDCHAQNKDRDLVFSRYAP